MKTLTANPCRRPAGPPRARPARGFRRHGGPPLEQLEDRTVPTVVFYSPFGGDSIYWVPGNTAGQPDNQIVTSPISNNPAALNALTVYLIFWGKSWTNQTAQKYASDAQAIIASDYLSGLQDYGSDGLANYGDYTIDNSKADPNNRDPEIQKILDSQETFWTKPTGVAPNPTGSNWGEPGYHQSPIYVVVCDNGPGGGGNGGGLYTYNGTTYLTNGITLSNGMQEDTFTDIFSHELVERMSDGTGGDPDERDAPGERMGWRTDRR